MGSAKYSKTGERDKMIKEGDRGILPFLYVSTKKKKKKKTSPTERD